MDKPKRRFDPSGFDDAEEEGRRAATSSGARYGMRERIAPSIQNEASGDQGSASASGSDQTMAHDALSSTGGASNAQVAQAAGTGAPTTMASRGRAVRGGASRSSSRGRASLARASRTGSSRAGSSRAGSSRARSSGTVSSRAGASRAMASRPSISRGMASRGKPSRGRGSCIRRGSGQAQSSLPQMNQALPQDQSVNPQATQIQPQIAFAPPLTTTQTLSQGQFAESQTTQATAQATAQATTRPQTEAEIIRAALAEFRASRPQESTDPYEIEPSNLAGEMLDDMDAERERESFAMRERLGALLVETAEEEDSGGPSGSAFGVESEVELNQQARTTYGNEIDGDEDVGAQSQVIENQASNVVDPDETEDEEDSGESKILYRRSIYGNQPPVDSRVTNEQRSQAQAESQPGPSRYSGNNLGTETAKVMNEATRETVACENAEEEGLGNEYLLQHRARRGSMDSTPDEEKSAQEKKDAQEQMETDDGDETMAE